jgi:ATP-dependent Clp protease ATP-binding subunit ClpC
MNYYNFTDSVRSALMRARDEATLLDHEYVGTEHLLLGLLGDEHGRATEVLRRLSADAGSIGEGVRTTVKRGQPTARPHADQPLTSRSKMVLELSMAEARDLGHAYVGQEHLLLGLMREGKGIAAQTLKGAGLETDRVREEVVHLVGALESSHSALGNSVVGVTVEVRYGDGSSLREDFPNAGEAIEYLRRR